MNLEMVNDWIEELEQAEMSLSNLRNLSALYTVRNQLLSEPKDNVANEINDVLPSYLQYIDVKRKYQLGEESKEKVTSQLKNVCKEIKELIEALYSGTDMPEERQLIKNLIKEMC